MNTEYIYEVLKGTAFAFTSFMNRYLVIHAYLDSLRLLIHRTNNNPEEKDQSPKAKGCVSQVLSHRSPPHFNLMHCLNTRPNLACLNHRFKYYRDRVLI